MDHYYNSLSLLESLFVEGKLTCRTLMPNHKYICEDLINKIFKKRSHEMVAIKNGPMTCIKYSNKKDVSIIITAYDSLT